MKNKWVMILGLAGLGYLAYKKLKKTQTVYIDSFDTDMPNVINMDTVV